MRPRIQVLLQVLQLVPKGHRALVAIAAAGLVALYLFLGGCANLAAPRDTTERLAYAEAQVTALAYTVADLRRSGAIDGDEFNKARDQLRQAASVLDRAWRFLERGEDRRAGALAGTVIELLQATRQAIEGETDEQFDQSTRGPGGAGDDRHGDRAHDTGAQSRLAGDPPGADGGPRPDGRRAPGDPRRAPAGAAAPGGDAVAA